jgi:hypothetical protein
MLIGTIGEGASSGDLRMSSYDFPYFVDGLKLVIVGLGIFAIPEIITLLRNDRAISQEAQIGGGWIAGIKDWFANIWLSVRCSIIGVIVGVIPGLGGSVVDWIAYGHTVQTSKDKSNFGKGDVRGVIGPESSNNAKEGGALVPTLLFGIPGSGSMAIFIGAIALLGSGQIEVGPAMLKNNLDITYAIVWLLALANVVGTVLCIAASGGIAKLTTIRFVLLAPFLFMIISFAAFQSGQNLMDLVALFAIGFLGILMRRFDWSRPAFLIGFVLSNPAETYANQAIQIAQSRFRKGFVEGIDYIFSPIVLVLLAITLVSVVLGLRQAKHILAEGDSKSGSKRAPMVFLLCVTAFIGYALFDAGSIPDYSRDRVFPMFVASVCLVGCAVMIARMILAPETDTIFADSERSAEAGQARYSLWSTLAWFAALLVATSLFGFIIALALFLFSFMRIRANMSAVFAAIYALAGIAFICTMAWALNRDFPPGLLQAYSNLPWPFT